MTVHPFGRLQDGAEIAEIRLAAPGGFAASVVTYGATLRDLVVPTSSGDRRRVVLGHATLDGYLVNHGYLGVTVGRHASRIREGRFALDGVTYHLSLNAQGRHHLHGGEAGFSHRPWRLISADDTSTLLGLTSADGDQGYPGAVEARCLYRLLEPATLQVTMSATADAPTPIALAHHSYFTLSPGRSVRNHYLQVNARRYTPFDKDLIPTGEILPVAGTPYDLTRIRELAEAAGDPAFYFDMIFVLEEAATQLKYAATLHSPDHSISMEVHTTEPCLIVYDGAKLPNSGIGVDGERHFAHAGICLEPMRFPDSVNIPRFPSSILRPHETYSQVTEYRFSTAG
jgi:aldose 1-epimerase